MPDRLRRLIGGDADERTSVDEFRRRLARLGTITHEQHDEVETGRVTLPPPPRSPAPSTPPTPPRSEPAPPTPDAAPSSSSLTPRPVATARRPPHPRTMAPSAGAADVAALATPIDTLPRHHPWRRVPALVLAGLVAVVLVLWVIGVASDDSPPASERLRLTAPTTSVAPTTAPPTTATAPPTQPTGAVPAAVAPTAPGGTGYAVPGDRLSTVVSATAMCWLQIRAPGAATVTRVLNPGESMTVDMPSPETIRLGNPAGVQIVVNGRPLTIATAAGKAVTLTVAGGAPG